MNFSKSVHDYIGYFQIDRCSLEPIKSAFGLGRVKDDVIILNLV